MKKSYTGLKGSDVAIKGHQYVQQLVKLIDCKIWRKCDNPKAQEILERIFTQAGFEPADVQFFHFSIGDRGEATTIEPKSDFWCYALYRGEDIGFGVSVKYNGQSTLSLDSRKIDDALGTIKHLHPLAFQGLQKLIGDSHYAQQFNQDFSHEMRDYYFMKELDISTRQAIVQFMEDPLVFQTILENGLKGRGERQAHVLLYPVKPGSLKPSELVIQNTTTLIDMLMSEHRKMPYRHKGEINTTQASVPVFKDANNSDFYNTVRFANMVSLQRRGGDIQRHNLQTKIRLPFLTRFLQSYNKLNNQGLGGQQARVTQDLFQEHAQEVLTEQGYQTGEVLLRANPSGGEIGATHFESLLDYDQQHAIFDWTGCLKARIALEKFLGTKTGQNMLNPPTTSDSTFIERSLFHKLSAEERRHIKVFFEQNLGIVIDYIVFRRLGSDLRLHEDYQYILFNEVNFSQTLEFKPLLFSKASYLTMVMKNMGNSTKAWKECLYLGLVTVKRSGSGSRYHKSKMAISTSISLLEHVNERIILKKEAMVDKSEECNRLVQEALIEDELSVFLDMENHTQNNLAD